MRGQSHLKRIIDDNPSLNYENYPQYDPFIQNISFPDVRAAEGRIYVGPHQLTFAKAEQIGPKMPLKKMLKISPTFSPLEVIGWVDLL